MLLNSRFGESSENVVVMVLGNEKRDCKRIYSQVEGAQIAMRYCMETVLSQHDFSTEAVLLETRYQ